MCPLGFLVHAHLPSMPPFHVRNSLALYVPSQRVEELKPDTHTTLVGRWDPETAGGSHNFPVQLTAPHTAPPSESSAFSILISWSCSLLLGLELSL